MKKEIFLFGIIFLFLNSILYSQSGWFQQQSGLNVSLNSIFFINSNTGWICGDSGKIIKTTNGGNNWILQNSNTINALNSIFFINENIGWCAGGKLDPSFSVLSRMIVLRTENAGETWSMIYNQPSFTSHFISIHFIDELHGYVVEQGSTGFVSVGGIWLTSNGGANWYGSQSSVPAYYDVQFSDNNTGWVLGKIWDDVGTDTAYIYKSINGGISWDKIYQKRKSNLNALHFINSNTGWVGGRDYENFPTQNFILKTIDSGINWQKINLSLENSVNSIFFINSDLGWTCGSRIFHSNDGGLSWHYQFGTASDYLKSIFFTDSLTGWSCSYNGKILKTFTGGINSISSSNQNIPNKFSLHQNYPNPFNPSTVISYELRVTSFINLKVYNSLGKAVTTLVNEKQNVGNYKVEFDGTNFSSGIYFYKLIADDYSEVKKMTLIK